MQIKISNDFGTDIIVNYTNGGAEQSVTVVPKQPTNINIDLGTGFTIYTGVTYTEEIVGSKKVSLAPNQSNVDIEQGGQDYTTSMLDVPRLNINPLASSIFTYEYVYEKGSINPDHSNKNSTHYQYVVKFTYSGSGTGGKNDGDIGNDNEPDITIGHDGIPPT